MKKLILLVENLFNFRKAFKKSFSIFGEVHDVASSPAFSEVSFIVLFAFQLDQFFLGHFMFFRLFWQETRRFDHS